MYGKPGSPLWDRRFGTELYVDRKAYIKAILFIRENGAPYLRAISISDLWSMVTSFVTENFWYIGRSSFLSVLDGSYLHRVTPEDKAALAAALAASPLFHPTAELTIYPLVPIRVLNGFECERFFLISAQNLNHAHLPPRAEGSNLEPTSFPPFAAWDGVRQRPVAAWLGVRSPLPIVSDKMAAAILGAVALTPRPSQRFMFSGRKMFGGKCTVGEGVTVRGFGEPHTPPLMNDIKVASSDHAWLGKLAMLLDLEDKSSKSRVRALEYFYRAWFLNPRERFPALCMSLDSLVGADHGHTSAAVNFVKDLIGGHIDDQRLRLLMRVRGAVIHGAAPDVYDSENYAQYYVDYGTDPIHDLELVVAKCLRETIFEGKLKYHLDPDEKYIKEAQSRGMIPKEISPETIISSEV